MRYDFVIIGAGLVGLATAYRILQRTPQAKVIVLEKEPRVAAHQSGRNSGVVHTGVYYKPGSLKSTLCTEGRRELIEFARAHGISYQERGKLIVATRPEELPRLATLHERAQTNGVVAVELLSPEQMRDREPHVAGIQGLWVPGAGTIDFFGVALALVQEIVARGGEVRLQACVEHASHTEQEWQLVGNFAPITTGFVVNCAGLFSDTVARRLGGSPTGEIIPFRGEYYLLTEQAQHLCRGLIYPVPDPSFPFLGVHFTRRHDDSVECGPNAVLALAREGYSWTTVRGSELIQAVRSTGFQRLALKHWRMGLAEIHRSLSKAAFVRSLQRLVPTVRAEDLLPSPAGVRAQVVRPDGTLEEDFAFENGPQALHVLNAPSPAATSCLAIGRIISERVVPATLPTTS
jgi:L-2-hydroxyglutarate oxidase LhgO